MTRASRITEAPTRVSVFGSRSPMTWRDALVVLVGVAQVEVDEDPLDVLPELVLDGLVESVDPVEVGDACRGGLRSEDGLGLAARGSAGPGRR